MIRLKTMFKAFMIISALFLGTFLEASNAQQLENQPQSDKEPQIGQNNNYWPRYNNAPGQQPNAFPYGGTNPNQGYIQQSGFPYDNQRGQGQNLPSSSPGSGNIPSYLLGAQQNQPNNLLNAYQPQYGSQGNPKVPNVSRYQITYPPNFDFGSANAAALYYTGPQVSNGYPSYYRSSPLQNAHNDPQKNYGSNYPASNAEASAASSSASSSTASSSSASSSSASSSPSYDRRRNNAPAPGYNKPSTTDDNVKRAVIFAETLFHMLSNDNSFKIVFHPNTTEEQSSALVPYMIFRGLRSCGYVNAAQKIAEDSIAFMQNFPPKSPTSSYAEMMCQIMMMQFDSLGLIENDPKSQAIVLGKAMTSALSQIENPPVLQNNDKRPGDKSEPSPQPNLPDYPAKNGNDNGSYLNYNNPYQYPQVNTDSFLNKQPNQPNVSKIYNQSPDDPISYDKPPDKKTDQSNVSSTAKPIDNNNNGNGNGYNPFGYQLGLDDYPADDYDGWGYGDGDDGDNLKDGDRYISYVPGYNPEVKTTQKPTTLDQKNNISNPLYVPMNDKDGVQGLSTTTPLPPTLGTQRNFILPILGQRNISTTTIKPENGNGGGYGDGNGGRYGYGYGGGNSGAYGYGGGNSGAYGYGGGNRGAYGYGGGNSGAYGYGGGNSGAYGYGGGNSGAYGYGGGNSGTYGYGGGNSGAYGYGGGYSYGGGNGGGNEKDGDRYIPNGPGYNPEVKTTQKPTTLDQKNNTSNPLYVPMNDKDGGQGLSTTTFLPPISGNLQNLMFPLWGQGIISTTTIKPETSTGSNSTQTPDKNIPLSIVTPIFPTNIPDNSQNPDLKKKSDDESKDRMQILKKWALECMRNGKFNFDAFGNIIAALVKFNQQTHPDEKPQKLLDKTLIEAIVALAQLLVQSSANNGSIQPQNTVQPVQLPPNSNQSNTNNSSNQPQNVIPIVQIPVQLVPSQPNNQNASQNILNPNNQTGQGNWNSQTVTGNNASLPLGLNPVLQPNNPPVNTTPVLQPNANSYPDMQNNPINQSVLLLPNIQQKNQTALQNILNPNNQTGQGNWNSQPVTGNNAGLPLGLGTVFQPQNQQNGWNNYPNQYPGKQNTPVMQPGSINTNILQQPIPIDSQNAAQNNYFYDGNQAGQNNLPQLSNNNANSQQFGQQSSVPTQINADQRNWNSNYNPSSISQPINPNPGVPNMNNLQYPSDNQANFPRFQQNVNNPGSLQNGNERSWSSAQSSATSFSVQPNNQGFTGDQGNWNPSYVQNGNQDNWAAPPQNTNKGNWGAPSQNANQGNWGAPPQNANQYNWGPPPQNGNQYNWGAPAQNGFRQP